MALVESEIDLATALGKERVILDTVTNRKAEIIYVSDTVGAVVSSVNVSISPCDTASTSVPEPKEILFIS